jgi:hypothetical protein
MRKGEFLKPVTNHATQPTVDEDEVILEMVDNGQSPVFIEYLSDPNATIDSVGKY